MKRVILVTGGQRSGKSCYAEKLALRHSDHPVYLATAHIWDEEFRQRVLRHQQRRGPEWTNIEEERYLSQHDVAGRTVLIDCLTLWATNFFFDEKDEVDPHIVFARMRQELDNFLMQDAQYIFVTNEIGLGGTHANAIQRRFTDLLGLLNQYVAEQADEVYFLVSGIPVKIKG